MLLATYYFDLDCSDGVRTTYPLNLLFKWTPSVYQTNSIWPTEIPTSGIVRLYP
jgi:hypothetical protein